MHEEWVMYRLQFYRVLGRTLPLAHVVEFSQLILSVTLPNTESSQPLLTNYSTDDDGS